MNAALFELDDPAHASDFAGAVVRQINYPTARRVIEENHYLGSAGSTVASYGMFVDGVLAGVMTFGTTVSLVSGAICGAEHRSKVLELTRLFMFDWAGKNAESSFIGATLRSLRPFAQAQGGLILLSYADTNAGHIGTIYQATNWLYTGESVSTVYVMDDGSLVHNRVASDPRKGKWATGMEHRKSAPKHRYVSFVGSRGQVAVLRRSLRWPTLPYPKSCGASLEGETSIEPDGRARFDPSAPLQSSEAEVTS